MGVPHFPPGSPPGFLSLKKAPDIVNFFINVLSLLVLDGVRVVQIGRFKKFLKMIFGRSGLVLDVAFGSCYALLAGVAGSLVVVAVVGYYNDVIGSLLLPLLATLSALGCSRPSL
jgi:hypothetical protein